MEKLYDFVMVVDRGTSIRQTTMQATQEEQQKFMKMFNDLTEGMDWCKYVTCIDPEMFRNIQAP